ncbi:tetratricopeptide repeat protein [Micromonospora sp. WMMD1102]|uniref:tetratricopeptide repeat protein n=1 Tax=Micromonospora sp. WMMD1102 TaxID=3016105 RepID=UPI0024153DA8|nr:tetratricopeptide repeat protein [Micromonospora sp. WMMD1102]MDG4791634.1 tetratricopeptide repeat protein [Micromonospora sp. WMMD1102]
MRARFRAAPHRDFSAAAEYADLAIKHIDRLPQSPREIGNRIFLEKNFRALLAVRDKRPDDALRLLEEGLADIRRLCPARHQTESPIFLQNRARVYAALKRFDSAVTSYSEAIALEPFCAELHFKRGTSHHALGDHQAALTDYRLALQAGPPRPEMHLNAALAHAALDDDDHALDEYGHTLELNPGHLSARLKRATLHYRAGRLAEAGEDAEVGLRIDPRHADLLCVRGLVRLSTGDLDAALADFTAAVETNPGHTAALKNRSSAWFAKGDLNSALRDADRCVATRPDGAAYLNRGYLHQSLGSWQQAMADYNRAAGYQDADHAELHRRQASCVRALMEQTVLARA